MNRWIFKPALTALAVMGLASPMMAQNIKLSGPHFNLNIIGVDKGKTTDMRNSDRHTIFVPLNNTGDPLSGTRIYLVPGSDFAVCDGNGFDDAVDCDGNLKGTGAVFELPCNLNIPNDQQLFLPCDVPEAQQASYSVYARALGKPSGKATITTCATDPLDDTVVCSTQNAVVVRPISTNGNKPAWQNVTNALTSIVTCFDSGTGNFGPDACEAGKTVRIALFAGGLEDWFWNYYNQGLRLTQVRFYLQ
jgi:hypothetical protein